MNRHGPARSRKGAVCRARFKIGLLLAALLLAAPAMPHAGAGSDAEGLHGVPDLPEDLSAPDAPLGQFPPAGGDSMFRRFSATRELSKTWQTMFEVPVALSPQTDPGAHIAANDGLNWVTAFEPLNRVYFSRSIGWAHMKWYPGGQLQSTEVVQWEWSEIVNVAARPWWIISLGGGLGFMDGMIFYKSGAFVHRFEPFVPIQIGTGLRLGRSWFVDAKLLQSSYFGPGPVASAARTVIGVGYNY